MVQQLNTGVLVLLAETWNRLEGWVRTPVILAGLGVLLALSEASWGQELLSGPMVGHTTSTSARIWVETDRRAEVTVRFWQEPRVALTRSLGEPMRLGVARGWTSADPPHTGMVELEGLQAGWMVYYELELDGKAQRPQTPQVFSLFPPRDHGADPPSFSVAFASCMFPGRVPVQPIWDQVSLRRPSALMLIGDNNYMPNHPSAYETSSEVVAYAMGRYHRFLRDLPGLRTLLATTPTYGIWDDHDYGPNDSDRTFRWRELSLDLFKRYYPNPSAGLPDTPGVFHSFQLGDAEFFLLDDRYHRDPNLAEDRATMLGAGQLRWLKDSLLASTATFKVIVNGGTMVVDRGGSGEDWARFGTERDDFIRWLFEQMITGVVFAAGDWHVGTISRLYRPEDRYPLYELLSSNAGVSLPVPGGPATGQGHSRFHHFVGEEVLGFNFGLLRFSGPRGSRTITLEIVDSQGTARIQLTLGEQDLRPRQQGREQ